MIDLGRELTLRIAASQREYEADGAVPLEGTVSRAQRKRRLRRGTTLAIAGVAVLALGAGGVVTGQRYLDTPPAPYFLPEGGGNAVIAVDGPDPTAADISIECGDAAPLPVTEADGFSLDVTVDPEGEYYEMYGYLEGNATVENKNEEYFPGFLLQPTLVIVKDDVVIGLQPAGGYYGEMAFTIGRTELSQMVEVGPWSLCTPEDTTVLEPGDYQVYLVATVANSPEIFTLARSSQFAWFGGDRWLEPTDWECGDDMMTMVFGSGSASAACMAAVRPDAVWDADSRSVAIPYRDGAVTRVFSTQLISEPFNYTAREPDEDPWGAPNPDAVMPNNATAPCGAEVGWTEDGDEPSLALVGTPVLSEETVAEGVTAKVWVPFGPGGVESRTATVEFPGTSPALIVGQRDVERGEYVLSVSTVIGHARVAINQGRDVDLSRALGPAEVPVEFTDVRWCEGSDQTAQPQVYVDAPLGIVAEDGRHDASWFTFFVYGDWM